MVLVLVSGRYFPRTHQKTSTRICGFIWNHSRNDHCERCAKIDLVIRDGSPLSVYLRSEPRSVRSALHCPWVRRGAGRRPPPPLSLLHPGWRGGAETTGGAAHTAAGCGVQERPWRHTEARWNRVGPDQQGRVSVMICETDDGLVLRLRREDRL